MTTRYEIECLGGKLVAAVIVDNETSVRVIDDNKAWEEWWALYQKHEDERAEFVERWRAEHSER